NSKAVLVAVQELREAMMRHCFEYGPVEISEAANIPQQTLESGSCPEHWTVSKLGNVASMHSGGTPSRSRPEFWNGTVPWIKTGEVRYGVIAKAEEFITEKGLAESSARMVPKGTLLMAMYG